MDHIILLRLMRERYPSHQTNAVSPRIEFTTHTSRAEHFIIVSLSPLQTIKADNDSDSDDKINIILLSIGEQHKFTSCF